MGRSPATTRGELSHIALGLFVQRGFDRTTIEDIVTAAGIGRRTFFRYFASKNDLPWGEFDDLLDRMRAHLAAIPPDVPLIEAIRQAVVEFNRFPADEVPFHRQRMWLLLNVPDLMAHSTLRYSGWRQVVADFVAERRGEPASTLAPQSLAWVSLSLCLAAYEQWLEQDDADLLQLIDEAFDRISEAFATPSPGS